MRSVRIPLDYYKKPDGYTKWKTWLSVAAVIAVLAWVGTRNPTKGIATHGTLASVHATWDEKCEACHVPFTPIDGKAWTAPLSAAFSAALGSKPVTSDSKCQDCHKGLADHHENMLVNDSGSCASCHADHRGRETHLNRVADSQCVRCHGALENHVKAGTKPAFAANVSGFGIDADSHPEFRLFRNGPPQDPGKLKFTHKQHMTRGQPKGADGKALMFVADMSKELQERYSNKKVGDVGGVQLDCASCHRPIGDRSLAPAGQSTSPGGALGGKAYMARATFESDCYACHALDYDKNLPPIRHGLQPDEVYEYLFGAYSRRLLEGGDAAGKEAARPRELAVPGGVAQKPGGDEAMGPIKKKVGAAQRILLGGQRCGECHTYEGADGKDVVLPENWEEKPNFRIARPKVLEVWLPHSRFDHSAHVAVADCQKCHPRAYPSASDASMVATDVMIPQAAVCRECHTPHQPKSATASATSGAGFSCTECHGYHNGDKSRPAPPPASRNAAMEADLRHFLAKTTTGR